MHASMAARADGTQRLPDCSWVGRGGARAQQQDAGDSQVRSAAQACIIATSDCAVAPYGAWPSRTPTPARRRAAPGLERHPRVVGRGHSRSPPARRGAVGTGTCQRCGAGRKFLLAIKDRKSHKIHQCTCCTIPYDERLCTILGSSPPTDPRMGTWCRRPHANRTIPAISPVQATSTRTEPYDP
jgi:hypothetical protein